MVTTIQQVCDHQRRRKARVAEPQAESAKLLIESMWEHHGKQVVLHRYARRQHAR